ncbi:cupin domain-containing protein [Aeromonas sp. BIGb0445]|uniref:ribosomal protein uL16 3-hydroxylase n=1 Tax=Aeromonas sp. BIGb0445 TaxID=2940593 RepID=UPI00216A0196|nr:cupin domain-containing protein [Aeromonas sp. BIGb0445]MCS3458350.1 50S ribosomal protein L16 3-hydroxylase [Aeromonas sp. BIGb0445]
MYELNLDIAHFLEHHWQKRPLLIKGGFTQFQDPISPDELAGLAMEKEIESRLVTCKDDQWTAEHGPFEDYDQLSERDWTLLIQACNHWAPEVHELAVPFQFIPGWRFDDVMVSFSTPGGGVGPHIDQYDVFITQGVGKRHWRVGDAQQITEYAAHRALRHCGPFEAIIDVEMEPGDILYIPPGFPHEGYAIEPSMNFSVGFRAPDARDLLTSFADHLIDNEIRTERYADPDLKPCRHHGEIQQHELHRLRELMQQALDDETLFKEWFGATISEAKHDLDVMPLPQDDAPDYSSDEVADLLTQGQPAVRVPGLRCVWFSDDNQTCYIDGEAWTLGEPDGAALKLLCDRDLVTQSDMVDLADQAGFLHLFTRLVNRGYWFFD